MRRHTHNPVSQYMLVACLGLALLLGQMFKLHMHLQHGEIPSATTGHILDVHVASFLYDEIHDSQHHDGASDHHHTAEIDVNSDGFVKKVELINPLVLLFFILCIFLCLPQLRRVWEKFSPESEHLPNYYLLHPPLRAPPV